MGIDKFMNQLNNTFNIAFYIKENKLNDISELIFDFNSIIHNSINDLLLFINNKQIDKIEIDDEMVNIVSNNFINHIKNTINTNIKCLISIFFDGVPSINKINEQKHRKFYGRLEKKIGEIININTAIRGDGKNDWDRNKISPGTDFMIKLARYFKSYEFKNLLYKNIDNVEINIISDTLEIDEAEIKIVRYIKNNYKK
jgi:5'-3' exonuclease